jgi:hypothetical protein
MRRLVLRNQVVLGSVNASRDHFQLAVNDLAQAQARWHEHVAELITNQYEYTDFDNACQHHDADEIKVVLEWSGDRNARAGEGQPIGVSRSLSGLNGLEFYILCLRCSAAPPKLVSVPIVPE